MKLFIPVNKHHSVQHPPWFTPEIRHSLKRLRTLRRKYKLHPSQNNLANIDSLEATIQEMISYIMKLVLLAILPQQIVTKYTNT